MLTKRVTVTVHASDPLSRAGLISHLRHQPSLDVLPERAEDGHGGPEGAPEKRDAPAVAVLLADRIDESTTAELRRLLRGRDQRVVLVAGELREPDLLSVVEYGVRAIIWRHQATEQRLLSAVHSAARGEGELPPDLVSRLLNQVGRLRRATPAGHRTPGCPPWTRRTGGRAAACGGADSARRATTSIRTCSHLRVPPRRGPDPPGGPFGVCPRRVREVRAALRVRAARCPAGLRAAARQPRAADPARRRLR
ncbi:hypothetical protein [Streptomyces sp. NPDC093071]|uniref:hypothetical protein n=1 Tax=Streptomyces sp. NPDC093071 TaxID=3366022 RepID=UPI003825927B